MKKLLLMTFVCLCFFFNLNAQEESKNYSTGKMVYAELGGPGVVFSFNFDSRFSSNSNLGLGYRVGLGFGIAEEQSYYNSSGYYSSNDNTTSYLTIPFGLNYVFGKPTSPHTFEVGIGATVLTRKMHLFTPDNAAQMGEGGNFIGHTTFMYRKQPIDGGFTWRIGLMPVLGTSSDIMLSAAVGIGYAF